MSTVVQEKPKVNNFCITFSTINGSGSATANTIILKSLFKMGIPVSGKNIFPSNIQGLPTWYSIRLSSKGYLARIEEDDIVVAMNSITIEKEINSLAPGGVLFYADDIKLPDLRTDIITYPMPVKKIVRESESPASLRDYLANMVYVGILAQSLGIPMDIVYKALDSQFKGKKKAVDSNFTVIQKAFEWAASHLEKKDVYRVEPMSGTDGYIMADGNTAGALGSIYGGLQFTAWYPITPATSLAETLNEYLPILRRDPATGKMTSVVVQAEDELAAIGMAIGAGWAGLRAMTSTSGPGLSLMTEYLGLAYYTEVPVVVWDVQRVGPSTGLPTRTAQGDLTEAYFMSHGDTQFVILLPGSVTEIFEFGWRAFDIAERLQTPIIIMTDLDFGMNQWMTKAFEYPSEAMDRGKVLWEEDLERIIAQGENWGRYLDVDGDGIPYRTLPGNRHPRSAYFCRGTGHDEFARYSEEPEVWERVMNRIAKKFETAKQLLPRPIIKSREGAKIGIIGYGSTDPAILEAIDLLGEKGVSVDYLRLRAIPLQEEVEKFIESHERTYVVELNRDGQLNQLLRVELPNMCANIISLAHCDGLPITAKWIVEGISTSEVK